MRMQDAARGTRAFRVRFHAYMSVAAQAAWQWLLCHAVENSDVTIQKQLLRMRLTVDGSEAGTSARQATTALGIDSALEKRGVDSCVYIVVLDGGSHSVKPHGHRVQPRHTQQRRCRHAASQTVEQCSHEDENMPSCLHTEAGEIACGAAVSLDRTLPDD